MYVDMNELLELIKEKFRVVIKISVWAKIRQQSNFMVLKRIKI